MEMTQYVKWNEKVKRKNATMWPQEQHAEDVDLFTLISVCLFFLFFYSCIMSRRFMSIYLSTQMILTLNKGIYYICTSPETPLRRPLPDNHSSQFHATRDTWTNSQRKYTNQPANYLNGYWKKKKVEK